MMQSECKFEVATRKISGIKILKPQEFVYSEIIVLYLFFFSFGNSKSLKEVLKHCFAEDVIENWLHF